MGKEPDESPPQYDPPPGHPPALPEAQQSVYRPPAPTSTLAIASFVLGILAILSLCFGGFPGLVLGPAALFPGILARNEVARSRGEISGDALASAGIVMGGIALFGGILALVVFLMSGWILWEFSSGAAPFPPGPASPPVTPGVP